MTKSLVVLLYGRRIGEVRQAASGRLAFCYDGDWVEDGPGVPLSISLPLSAREHGHDRIAPYLWGLLPDNADIRRSIASGLPGRVSPENPFAMLGGMGEDCAGAVQFVRPERLAELEGSGGVDWLEPGEVAVLLARARRKLPPGALRQAGGGRYSLSGAQPKIALHRGGSESKTQWGLPTGRTPTTHILKPPMAGLPGQAEGEHFCLSLSAALGIPTARSEVICFGDEVAIVSERFDRLQRADGSWLRVHQEDMCQALAVMPGEKYQSDGGPSPERIIRDVLRNSAASSEEVDADISAFVKAIALNWVILGTDAHAKNFSVIHGRRMVYRLAPLYDINSALPYDDPRDVTMSFKVGGYDRFELYPRHWERFAKGCGFDPGEMMAILRDLVERLPDLSARLARECRKAGLTDPIVSVLAEKISLRCHTLKSAAYGAVTRKRAVQDGSTAS